MINEDIKWKQIKDLDDGLRVLMRDCKKYPGIVFYGFLVGNKNVDPEVWVCMLMYSDNDVCFKPCFSPMGNVSNYKNLEWAEVPE